MSDMRSHVWDDSEPESYIEEPATAESVRAAEMELGAILDARSHRNTKYRGSWTSHLHAIRSKHAAPGDYDDDFTDDGDFFGAIR